MPRVLRIINRLNLGGITYNTAYLTKYLAPEFETLLLAGMKQESEESSEFIVEQLGLKAQYLTGMHREINLKKDYEVYKEIKSIIRQFKPDIVHTHAAKAGTLGRLAAHHCGVKIILHTFHGHVFHSYFSPLKTKMFINIERYLASKSTRIIAISQKQKQELCEQFRICRPEKCEVIPLGFELDRFRTDMEQKRKSFREQFQIRNDELAVGIIGRITAIKNHALFLDAFSRVRQAATRKIKAVIIGDGEDLEKAKQQCRSLHLVFCTHEAPDEAADVIFTSWIKNVDWAIAGLDLVAMTSLNEGTPVSLIEAQAAGKPVVSTRVGGVEEVMSDHETGLLVNTFSANDFSDALLMLIQNHSLRKQFADAGWEFVYRRHNVNRLVNDIKALYHRLLKDAADK